MAKSPVAELEAELAAKRDRVRECEENLGKERAAAEEYVAKKVSKAEEALRVAREDADGYVALIAQALGLPNPQLARQVKQRRARVQELLDDHKTPEQIAGEVKQSLEVVKEDITFLTEKASAPVRKRGWKRERVRELFAGGVSLEKIAGELGIGVGSVRAHVYQLRASGKLPEENTSPAAPRTVASAPPPAVPPAEPSRPQPLTSAGDEVEALRREVSRQQGDQKAKAVVLLASPTNGHSHRVVVDRMGDGTTQSDGTGHVHKVYRFVVSLAAGHQHGLRVPPSVRES